MWRRSLASESSSFISGAVIPVDGGAGTKKYPDLPGLFAEADQPPMRTQAPPSMT